MEHLKKGDAYKIDAFFQPRKYRLISVSAPDLTDHFCKQLQIHPALIAQQIKGIS